MYIHKAHYHSPTPLCISFPTLSYTILVQLAYIPCPSIHTAKNYKCVALCGPCTTESHSFHHLICQGPLMLVCLHVLEVHAPLSHGSVSLPLLPLPNTGTVLPRTCHCTVCPSYVFVVISYQDSCRRFSRDICPDTPSRMTVAGCRYYLAQCMLDFL